MRKSYFQRILTVFLAVIMIAGACSSVFAVSAATGDETTSAASENDGSNESADNSENNYSSFRSMEEISRLLYTSSYADYSEKYKNMPVGTDTITVNGIDYDSEKTDADVKVLENYEGAATALYTPNTGETAWTFSVPTSGMYAISIDYFAVSELDGERVSSYTTIERMLFVDGALPFTEARYLYFPRQWKYTDDSYLLDGDGNFVYEYDYDGSVVRKRLKFDYAGNDIRPDRVEAPEWRDYFLRDWNGFTMEPFQIYLTAGEHTISLDASREPMAISKIEIYGYHDEISYSEFLQNKLDEGVKVIENVDGGAIRVQFEEPSLLSDANLYPDTNRTSAITLPSSPAYWKFNVLTVNTINSWTEYKVTVPEDGLYTISMRFRQNARIGMFTSRRLVINNELQFKEASELRFNYSPDWQSVILNDGSEEYKDGFKFYLKKGENTLRFDVVLGDMSYYVNEIKAYVEVLQNSYQSILRLTGTNPDAQRDYGFMRLIPQAIYDIGNISVKMFELYNKLVEETGTSGDQANAIHTYATLFEKMANDPNEIAGNFLLFKSYVASMSTWMYTELGQSIVADYFVIGGTNDELPPAMATTLDFVKFEIRAFIASFKMDYTTIDFVIEEGQEYSYDDDDVVEVWIASGRDDALIKRRLADNYFTPETGYKMRYKVISLSVINAVLAGIGPDISDLGANDAITWGLRDGVLPLNDMKNFDEVCTWFDNSLLEQCSLYGVTYGLPISMDFYMTFYRSDVFYNLSIDVPTTWDELYDTLPTLQANNMEVGLPIGLEGTKLFLYQRNIELYKENGMQINLDSNAALDAFTDLCNMYTKYNCPVSYDLTRFRSGEIPLVVASFTTYNSLMGFVEIRGLWEMAPLLGIKGEDGSINHTSVSTTATATCLLRGCGNPDAAWAYISWLRSDEAETLTNRESRLLNNPTTKFQTVNTNVFLAQPWTISERAAISEQLKQLAGIPYYPGNYIVSTYVDSAFQIVYANKTNPADEMLNRIIYINREISRKREDFRMETYEDLQESANTNQ